MKESPVWNVLCWIPLILGIVVILTPELLVPVCTDFVEMKSGALRPMRCAYSAKAEILLGGLLTTVGLLLVLRRQFAAVLGLVVAAIGVCILVAPQSWVIGVCMSKTMPCRDTEIWLIAEGVLAIVVGLLLWWRFRKTLAGA